MAEQNESSGRYVYTSKKTTRAPKPRAYSPSFIKSPSNLAAAAKKTSSNSSSKKSSSDNKGTSVASLLTPVFDNTSFANSMAALGLPVGSGIRGKTTSKSAPLNLGGAATAAPEETGDTGFNFDGVAPDYAAFLAAANSSSGTDTYANRIADAEKRKAEAIAAIANGSQDLTTKLTDSRANQDAYYTQALQAQAAATSQAQQAQQAALSNIRSTQDQSNANAGIQVDTSKMADDQAFAAKQLAAQQAAYDAALRSNQTTNYGLNSSNIDAARSRGYEDQNTSRRTFDSALSELLDAQAAAKSSAASSAGSSYSDAMSQYTNDRDFAYQQYRDDKDDAFNLLKLQSGGTSDPSYTPYEQLLMDLKSAGIKTPGNFTSRFNDYNKKALPGETGSFSKLFGGINPQSQAAIRAYLKAAGLL